MTASPNTAIARLVSAAPATTGATMITPDEFMMIKSMANAVCTSNLATAFNKSPADVIVALTCARDMGIPYSVALTKGYVIKGKFDLQIEVKLGMVMGRLPDFDYEIIEQTALACEVKGHRKGRLPKSVRYTMDDARTAGLLEKNRDGTNWAHPGFFTNPKDQLLWRAMGRVLKLVAPDAIHNMPISFSDDDFSEDDLMQPGSPSGAVEVAADDKAPVTVVTATVQAGPAAATVAAPAASATVTRGAVPAKSAVVPAATPAAADKKSALAIAKEHARLFQERAAKAGHDTNSKRLALVNRLRQAHKEAKVSSLSLLGVHEWKDVWTWVDAAFDESGKERAATPAVPGSPAAEVQVAPASPPAGVERAADSAAPTLDLMAADPEELDRQLGALAAAEDEPPPPATPTEAASETPAEPRESGDPVRDAALDGDYEGLLLLCRHAEPITKRDMLLTSPHGSIWFIDGPILEALGYTNRSGAVSQNLKLRTPAERAAMARGVVDAISEAQSPRS